jgi:hypothetical protein
LPWIGYTMSTAMFVTRTEPLSEIAMFSCKANCYQQYSETERTAEAKTHGTDISVYDLLRMNVY